jgi:hypothetical protein
MSHRRFFSQLLLITLFSGFLLVFLHVFQPFAPYKALSAVSLGFFALLAMGMYFPSAKAAMSNDKNAFTRLIMLFTFLKMFLTAALIIGYHRIFKPADSFFLIPFFLTYVVFTGFETVFMSKLGKIKAR